MDGDRFEVAAERLPGADRAAQQRTQRGDRARVPHRQRAAVGQDVGDPGVGRVGQDPGDDGGQRRVQVGDDDRHAVDRGRAGDQGVVGRVLLVDAEHGRLGRRVARLDDVARTDRVGRQPVGQRDDEGVATGAQAQRQGGRVDQTRSPGSGRPTRAE